MQPVTSMVRGRVVAKVRTEVKVCTLRCQRLRALPDRLAVKTCTCIDAARRVAASAATTASRCRSCSCACRAYSLRQIAGNLRPVP